MAKKRNRGVNTGSILFAAESNTSETTDIPATNPPAINQKKKTFLSGSGFTERIAAVGICLMLVVGAFGSGLSETVSSTLKNLNQNIGLDENSSIIARLNPFAAPAAPVVTVTPQLSKEYIYAGSRLLAVEDANASSGSTPTATPTATPTPTSATPTPTPPIGGTYNAVDQFSPSNTGVWTYGYKANAASALTLFTNYGQPFGSAVDTWGIPYLMVAKNNTQAPWSYSSIRLPVDMLLLHPGPNGEHAVVRWKAPTTGTYQVNARFKRADEGDGTTTNVHIVHNHNNNQAEDFWTRPISNSNIEQIHNASRTVQAGETIDFAVDYGSNGTYNSDATALAAIITSSTSTATPTPTATATPAVTPTPNATPTATPIPAATPTATPPAANTYNAVNDFSPSNPSGAWSYGSRDSSGFAAYTGFGYDQPWTGINTWSATANGGCCLMVGKNMSTSNVPASYASIVHPKELLNLHPGPNGESSVVRWTVPAGGAGTYQVSGRFQGNDAGGATTDVHIFYNQTTELLPANNGINGYNSASSVIEFNLSKKVRAGETIDFVVGVGSNGTYNSDSTGLAAIITPSSSTTPTPTATATPAVTPTPNATPTPGGSRINVALAANYAIATASSALSNGAAGLAIDDIKNWATGLCWKDATPDIFPDTLEVEFNGSKTINEIDLYSVKDDYTNATDPTAAETFTIYGITNFDVQYWNGSSWLPVSNGSVTNNTYTWRKVLFTPVTTTKIRVVVNNALASYSRIVELQAWTDGTTGQARFSTMNQLDANTSDSALIDTIISGSLFDAWINLITR